MARQEHQTPWWERPAKSPGEAQYEPEREHLRAELARAWRADVNEGALRSESHWAGPGTPRAAA